MRKQRGSMNPLIASVIGAGVVVGGSMYATSSTTASIKAEADQIRLYGEALEGYRDAQVKGNVTPTLPTVQQLVSAGYLPNNFSLTLTHGVSIRGEIALLGNGKSESRVWIDSPPKTLTGSPDAGHVASLIQLLGATAGSSTPSSPSVITGYQGKWRAQNTNSQPYSILYLPPALRSPERNLDVSGHNGMQANLSFGAGSGIQRAGNINSSNVSAGTATLTSAAVSQNITSQNVITQNLNTGNTTAQQGSAGTATSPQVNTATLAGATVSSSWLNSQGDVAAQGNIRSRVLAFDANGSGWSMPDSSRVAIIGDKNMVTGSMILGGAIHSATRVNAREFLRVAGVATPGQPCSPNGLRGREGSGMPLFCIDNLWSHAPKAPPPPPPTPPMSDFYAGRDVEGCDLSREAMFKNAGPCECTYWFENKTLYSTQWPLNLTGSSYRVYFPNYPYSAANAQYHYSSFGGRLMRCE